MTTTQKALVLVEVGKPLTLMSVPIPEPEENELLIKLTATGLNALDQKIRDFNILNIPIPAILGLDLVGTVVKNGPGNTASFPVGSHVFSQYSKMSSGGLQEYSLVNAPYTALVPAGISDPDAAFSINAFTSTVCLFHPKIGFGFPFPDTPEAENFDYSAQKIVIIGGGTNCGKLAIQLARIAGIGTIITTASLAGGAEAELKAFGATHVISRHAPDADIEKQVRGIVGDELVQVYDTFHQDDHSLAVSLLSNSKQGTYTTLLPGKPSAAVAAQKKAGYKGFHIHGDSTGSPDLAVLFWKQFPRWLESGEVEASKYRVIEGLDAEKVNAALDGYKDLATGKRYHVRF
ncbi:Dehydrogenase [Lachnellula occidentalis]|uniref:Dehydrogenase n=1 Tax=Lachnellula occidentalis TaxID=215460 RepID=A0A8H8S4W0_9HELO|nr:Dehydrogenase [Lachnellula occidentalis]